MPTPSPGWDTDRPGGDDGRHHDGRAQPSERHPLPRGYYRALRTVGKRERDSQQMTSVD